MKVINQIEIYDIDDRDVSTWNEKPMLEVISHWAYKDRVVLKFQDKTITVSQRDLMLAIQNATNVRL